MSGIDYGNSYRITKKGKDLDRTIEGVYYSKIIKKWLVRIKVNNRLTSIGAYDTKDEAYTIYYLYK